jgi:hypothetical protein
MDILQITGKDVGELVENRHELLRLPLGYDVCARRLVVNQVPSMLFL